MQDKNSSQAANDRSDRREQVKDTDDCFELVECRDVMINTKAGKKGEKVVMDVTMQVKIITGGK